MADLTLDLFEQFTVNSPGAFTVDALTPIAGAKSLIHIFSTGLQQVRLAMPLVTTGVPQGITVGQWRMALKRSVANPVGFFGVTIGQSARDVTSLGTCYSLTIARSGTISNRVRLAKHTSGLDSQGTELAQAALAESTDVVTLSVIWDLVTGQFQVLQGTALDYSDLVEIFTHTDGSPLTAAAEGFFISDFNFGGSVHTVWFDNLILDTFD